MVVHGVAKSRTRLSNFTFAFHFHVLEKEMATHSSVLAWRIPGMGEPGGLASKGLHRVGLFFYYCCQIYFRALSIRTERAAALIFMGDGLQCILLCGYTIHYLTSLLLCCL